jgi:hypothetical protein
VAQDGWYYNMASIINAGTTSGTALNMTADTSGQLQLATGASATTAVTIDTSQNVGIGTTSPFSAAGWKALSIDGTSQSLLDLRVNGTSNGYVYASASQLAIVNNTATLPITFTTNSTERMRIDSSGNVLIGTTSTYAGSPEKLSVQTSNNICIATKSSTSADYNTVIWSATTSGNNPFVSFATETSFTQRGSITFNRGSTLTAYNTTSDERLKENIVDAPSAIDKINSIKIRSFDWKETGFHTDFGVIAQELNLVSPECVTIGDSGEEIKETWQVDTSALVPAMIKSIQEQQTIINDLKARIETLEAK